MEVRVEVEVEAVPGSYRPVRYSDWDATYRRSTVIGATGPLCRRSLRWSWYDPAPRRRLGCCRGW